MDCTFVRTGDAGKGRHLFACSTCKYEMVSKYSNPALLHRNCLLVEMPSVAQRAASYAMAVADYVAAGSPTCTPQQIKERLAICKACPFYENGACKKCGCNVNNRRNAYLNKLAMANQQCPDKPPRWLAIEGLNRG